MFAKIGRDLWDTEAFEVFGRRTDAAADRRQLSRDPVAGRIVHDADRQVVALFREVDPAIGDRQIVNVIVRVPKIVSIATKP